MSYYLVEANGVKLGGYIRIRSKLLYDLANLLYSEGSAGIGYIRRRIVNLESKHGSIIPISCLTDNMCYTQRYLVNSNTSNTLRMIYLKGQLDATYNELAFVLFITGMVDSADYLSIFRDVNRVVGRFSVKSTKAFSASSDVIKPILISQKSYTSLMMLYVQNCLNGVDYGVPMYDFVYHILKTAGLKSIKTRGSYYGIYMRLSDNMQGISVSSNCGISPSDDELNKYAEEIAFLLSAFPYMFDSSVVGRLFDILVSKNCPVFLEIVLRSPNFILKFERGCIKCGVS